MKVFSKKDGIYDLYQGDMLDLLEVIEPNSIDSIITDPPYELNFMGKSWDSRGVSFQKSTWEKCFYALKPGGYLLAFGGSRTFHRIACAIEDAGFEIRDTIMWLYGSGFPKSMNVGLAVDKSMGVESEVVGYASQTMPDFHDVGKQQKEISGINKRTFGQVQNAERKPQPIFKSQNKWDGWGTSLKPAFEPIIVARKPFEGSLVSNLEVNGIGAINIDGCRIPHNEQAKYTNRQPKNGAVFNTETSGYDNSENHVASANEDGRFPANLILTYDDTDVDEVCGGFPETKSTYNEDSKHEVEIHRENADNLKFGYKVRIDSSSYNDSGSAARYFYCAKASKKDREEGLQDGNIIEDGKQIRKNIHPSVKPTELMQYLIRLVSPPNAIILDPFNGSGSTGKAVFYENRERGSNYKYIGIELDETYLAISKARIDYVLGLSEDDLFSIETTNSISEAPALWKKQKLF